MAGALGNCYDRLVFGYVRDFVHLHVNAIDFDCAIFNFADNMLVAGALTLVLLRHAARGRGIPPSRLSRPSPTPSSRPPARNRPDPGPLSASTVAFGLARSHRCQMS